MGKLTAPLAVVLLGIGVAEAGIVTITFEQFAVGDGLAQVNAVTGPMGIMFDAALPATFQVVADPNDPKNKVAVAAPVGSAADMLINFSIPVKRTRVEFVNIPGDVGSQITAYQTMQDPNALGHDFAGSHSGDEPVVLEIDDSSPFSSVRIRALQMEQDGAATPLVFVDNIEILFDCAADLNNDGIADVSDFFLFVTSFAAGDRLADVDDDGDVDVQDFFAFILSFAAGCP